MSRLSASRVVNIDDLRRLAQRRLPKMVFDYLDGGAEAEITLRENSRAFDDVAFRPRCAVAFPDCNLRTTVLDAELSFPAILAPVGFSRLMHTQGELAAARAAGNAGTVYILSTISARRLEDVKAATTGPAWYQLYLLGGRAAAEAALDRARRAGYSALVVTIDTPIAGLRERDVRNGITQLLSGTLGEKLPHLPQIFARPGWLAAFLRDRGTPHLENVVLPDGPMPLVDVATALENAAVTWGDLRWLRQTWPGPIVIKGVHTAEDARRAVDEGAAAVIVSNHGGRQLDGVAATLRVLPEVVSAVGSQAEVLMDGGVRRGSDIVKALCLGARAVLIGRGYAYGLAAAGEPGVVRALDILRAGVLRTLKLLGCPSVTELDSSYVNVPPGWATGPFHAAPPM
jgi:isopentenyl diphosphate isomerase/L-lactate dehydrogenase-like FMN-dependent dehydrogenase